MKRELNIKPPVIAHRGASAYAPENTMLAFTKAAQMGAKWIEFDVMATSDGKPIIFHDELLDRTTNAKGELRHYSYDYLRALDAGKWFDPIFSGEKIPSLAQVLVFLRETHLSANIEIKPVADKEEELVLRVLAEVKKYLTNTSSTILFSSFCFKTLRFLRQHAPDVFIGLLMHEWHPDWEAASRLLECVSIDVNEKIMTPERAEQIKAAGKTLLCYTVNDGKRALELFSYGVDAVFSDAPDKILSLKIVR